MLGMGGLVLGWGHAWRSGEEVLEPERAGSPARQPEGVSAGAIEQERCIHRPVSSSAWQRVLAARCIERPGLEEPERPVGRRDSVGLTGWAEEAPSGTTEWVR